MWAKFVFLTKTNRSAILHDVLVIMLIPVLNETLSINKFQWMATSKQVIKNQMFMYVSQFTHTVYATPGHSRWKTFLLAFFCNNEYILWLVNEQKSLGGRSRVIIWISYLFFFVHVIFLWITEHFNHHW